MKNRKLLLLAVSAVVVLFVVVGCKTIQQVSQTLSNIKKIQFKLDRVSNFSLAGVKLSDIRSVSDVSITDGLRLTQAFNAKSLPADFTLLVAARNPNTGASGSQSVAATVTSLDWRLLIDDVETVSGVVNTPMEIPASGETAHIPVKINIDLYRFFGSKGYEHLANLALAVGGLGGSPARLKLDIRPTVNTILGPISYPGRITIVDREFR